MFGEEPVPSQTTPRLQETRAGRRSRIKAASGTQESLKVPDAGEVRAITPLSGSRGEARRLPTVNFMAVFRRSRSAPG
ncbi:hypothetical protein AAFF_G00226700 [Aldrovandia affinis]|uniref:Uncharacterized protein n=1 Tax=Aldrovandia affinis TaxID=143900 RepID=A0AAD7TBC6_9TELE|nr:hypothetical protein AAFF_G00226700 [Aldrovandia affinis]